jgi:hypothetical protein
MARSLRIPVEVLNRPRSVKAIPRNMPTMSEPTAYLMIMQRPRPMEIDEDTTTEIAEFNVRFLLILSK